METAVGSLGDRERLNREPLPAIRAILTDFTDWGSWLAYDNSFDTLRRKMFLV